MTATNLCLHYVGDHASPLFVTPERLGALIDEQLSAGRAAGSLAEYASASPDADRFTLSFDDAHVSLRTHALPVLRARGITATVFVPTDYVATSAFFLDWDGLAELAQAGWTIGSHTATHPRLGWRLYDEDAAAHRRRVEDELSRSREAIAAHLGEAPTLFAYPYGEAPLLARALAAEVGYRAAFTVTGEATWDGDRFAIPRVEPAGPRATSESPTGFSVVVPACDRARILSDVVTRLASSSYPEDRYEVLVVDDGSSEDLSPIFAEMPDNVRLLPRAGDATFRAGQARQRGADAARFDHLVFLDADVAAPPDLLWHHDWVHRHAERDTLLLGYLSGYNLHDLGHLHTPDAVIGADLDALPILPDRSREPTLRACLDNLDLIDEPWGLTYTGHMSLPRRALARVGGFATEFEGWGLEDVDLGIRLHRGGVRFAFSRFAVGYHVVDPSEPASRNPFRADAPSRDRFAGYLTNLDRLAERHAGDAPVEDYVARSRHDIDETCGRPGTVGIELGGAASVRSTHHTVLHRLQPGGVPTMELLDRVAYAKKVRAKTIYLLGGAVAEHPGFLEVVRAAADVCGWVSMQTLVYPFAAEGLAARAEEAGLRGVVALVESLDPEVHERLHGVGTFARFGAGLDALERTRLERSAHLALSAASWASLARTRETLTSRGWRIAEVTILDPALWTPAREHPLLRDLPISAPEAP